MYCFCCYVPCYGHHKSWPLLFNKIPPPLLLKMNCSNMYVNMLFDTFQLLLLYWTGNKPKMQYASFTSIPFEGKRYQYNCSQLMPFSALPICPPPILCKNLKSWSDPTAMLRDTSLFIVKSRAIQRAMVLWNTWKRILQLRLGWSF